MAAKTTRVQKAVAAYFHLAVESLRLGGSRTPALVRGRHVARYLERELDQRSYPEIGALYNTDHTNAMASCAHVKERLAVEDVDYTAPVETISKALARVAMTSEALEAKLEKRVELGVDGLSCPTCGAPVVKELQRQLEELRERLKVIEQRK